MKKGKLGASLLLCAALFCTPYAAHADTYFNDGGTPCVETPYPITLRVDGNYLPTDTEPIIKDGRTLIPLRAAGEAVGATVSWDQASQTATSTLNGLTVKFQIGNNKYYVNGYEYTTDVAPTTSGWRTMLPIRAFAEAFGVGVNWDQDLRNVIIDTPAVDAKMPPLPNGGDPEFIDMLKKYYVVSDSSNTMVGSWLGNGPYSPMGNNRYVYSAIFISELSDGTLQLVSVNAESTNGRYTSDIEVFKNNEGTLELSNDGFSFNVGSNHSYYKGVTAGYYNDMILDYKFDGDNIIYVGNRFPNGADRLTPNIHLSPMMSY